MPFICIDVEASGPVAPEYSLLSIGATVVRRVEGAGYALGEDFYVELKPVFPGAMPEAMKVHGLSLDVLQRDGAEPREALERLRAWTLAQCKNKSDKPV